MISDISIGLAQISSEPFAVDDNRTRSECAAREAFDQGADIVVLPEMIVHGYATNRARLALVAETINGPTLEAWCEVATRWQGYIIGGFCERDGEHIYNSAIAVGPEGLVLHYRKVHLFGVEKQAFQPGNLGFRVAKTRFGTIGICVCYDLRFVEVMRIFALRGADLLCVPAAWTVGFDNERWDANGMCPQARTAVLQANLNQIYVACASQVGNSGPFEFLGSSILADPYGRHSLGPLSGTQETVAVASIDISACKAAQVRSPLITPRADRRTDVYQIWTDGELL